MTPPPPSSTHEWPLTSSPPSLLLLLLSEFPPFHPFTTLLLPLPWQRGQRPSRPGSHTGLSVSGWLSLPADSPYCPRGHDKEEGGPESGMRLTGRQGRLREGEKLKEKCAFGGEGEQKPEDKAGRWLHGRRCSAATAHRPVWSTDVAFFTRLFLLVNT